MFVHCATLTLYFFNDPATTGTYTLSLRRSSDLTVSHSDQVVPGSCANRFVVKRTYTATDGCGNASTAVQTITVDDQTGPVITSIPADVTVNCAANVPPAADSAVTATDNTSETQTHSHPEHAVPVSNTNRRAAKRTST